MTFLINGVDVVPYVAFNGLGYQLSDVDAPDAGRTMDGTMERGKITDKDKFTFAFRPLTTDEMSRILTAVTHEYVECTYLSPRYGSTVTKTMYVGDRTATHCIEREDGRIYWKDFKFNLIER